MMARRLSAPPVFTSLTSLAAKEWKTRKRTAKDSRNCVILTKVLRVSVKLYMSCPKAKGRNKRMLRQPTSTLEQASWLIYSRIRSVATLRPSWFARLIRTSAQSRKRWQPWSLPSEPRWYRPKLWSTRKTLTPSFGNANSFNCNKSMRVQKSPKI